MDNDRPEEEEEEETKFEGRGYERNLVVVIERDIIQKNLNIRWDDIANLHDEKKLLEEEFVFPMLMPKLHTGILRSRAGVLMFGPRGTGKKMLAEAVATESSATFFNVTSSLLTEYTGLVSLLFESARFYAPSIIFIHEIDSLCSEHQVSRLVIAELCIQMDKMDALSSNSEEPGKIVRVLVTSNFPWNIDNDLRRRLEKRIYIPLPNSDRREALLRINLREVALDPDVDLKDIAGRLEGYSGSDITDVCRVVAKMGMCRKIAGLTAEQVKGLSKKELEPPVSKADFEQALAKCNKSVPEEDLQKYEKWI